MLAKYSSRRRPSQDRHEPFEQLEARQLLAAYTMSEYFPLDSGLTWQYAGTLNGDPATAVATSAAGPSVSGIATTRVRTVLTPTGGGDAITDARFYAHTSTGLRLMRENVIEPSLTASTLFDPGLRLIKPVVSDNEVVHFSKTFSGSSTDGRAWTGKIVGDATILGTEIIDTTAGSFEALKVSIVGDITEDGSTGWNAMGILAETRWLVRNVGTVRLDYIMEVHPSDEGAHTLRINMGLTEASRLGAVADFQVRGKGAVIPYDDTTPTTSDGTNFGGVDINGGTKTRIFKIFNTSSDPITLAAGNRGRITITGANAGEFTIVRQPDATIQPGGVALFSVRFDPSATGFRFADISFASSGDTAHAYRFAVRGTGLTVGRIQVAAAATSTPIQNGATTATASTGTRFGQVQEGGTASVERTFVISNAGVGNLVLAGSPRVTISGSAASDFTVVQQPTGNIPTGSSSTFTVRFDPTDTGNRSATVSIFSNDSINPTFTFVIVGTGIA